MKSRGYLLTLVVIGVLGVFFLGVFLWGTAVYNSLVSADESITSAWSQVENQYQRRADLIPNLVATVKGVAEHEKEGLQGVTEARARAGQIVVTRDVLADPQAFARFQAAQDNLSSALSRLLAVAENYPAIRANENFLTLQDQLEGTENRISIERRRYNELVQAYNTSIRLFPASLIAGLSGFEERQYFAPTPGSEEVPKVEFP